jgi:hypothetical protein
MIWDKVRSYWEHVGGTQWELDKHVENPFGPKILISPPSPQKKKELGPLGACCLTSLAARFFF